MARTTKPNRTQRPRKRDFRKEYQARVARGLAAGKSKAAARGHPRAADLPKPATTPIDRNLPLERALRRMRRGETQSAAAKAEGLTVERLRRYRQLHTASRYVGRGEWDIYDGRAQAFHMASEGKMVVVTLPNEDGSEIAKHFHAVNKFLYSNDDEYLHPFEGHGVVDVRGRFHQFETRPNVLRKMESMGDLNFIEIYADGGGL